MMRSQNQLSSDPSGVKLEDRVMLAGPVVKQTILGTESVRIAFSETIKPSDPSSFTALTDTGREKLQRFDFRTVEARKAAGLKGFPEANFYTFEAAFESGDGLKIAVNPEFGTAEEARVMANKYAKVAGQLPENLRSRLDEITVHDGVARFSNFDNRVSAYDKAETVGLEELLVHEAGHSVFRSLTSEQRQEWRDAQAADSKFLSFYGRQNPNGEDFEDTLVAYVALEKNPGAIKEARMKQLEDGIPNRLKFIDSLNLLDSPAEDKLAEKSPADK